jgi:hypothetical protein
MRRVIAARWLELVLPVSALALTLGSYRNAQATPVRRPLALAPLLGHASVRQMPPPRETVREASPPAASSPPARDQDGPQVQRLPPSSASRPLTLRLPAFIALGVGGLGAGGAVLAHLAATAPYNDPKLACAGRCSGASRTMVVGRAVLGGVAVLGIGIGLGLLMRSSEPERPSLAPTLRLGLSPRKAGATATWLF